MLIKYLLPISFCLLSFLNARGDNLYRPLNQPLGRDSDPKVVEDLSNFELWYRKAIWSTLSLPGMRFMANLIFPKSTIIYFDIDRLGIFLHFVMVLIIEQIISVMVAYTYSIDTPSPKMRNAASIPTEGWSLINGVRINR